MWIINHFNSFFFFWTHHGVAKNMEPLFIISKSYNMKKGGGKLLKLINLISICGTENRRSQSASPPSLFPVIVYDTTHVNSWIIVSTKSNQARFFLYHNFFNCAIAFFWCVCVSFISSLHNQSKHSWHCVSYAKCIKTRFGCDSSVHFIWKVTKVSNFLPSLFLHSDKIAKCELSSS